jgi:TetR/AcrR family transcriptional repressor of mexJK operon
MTRISPDLKSSAASPGSCDSGSRSRKAEQIFAAAQAIFLESGYGAASMDAVAARAGVSKATIYVHFKNKQALFEAIVNRRTAAVFGTLEFSEARSDLRQILTDLADKFLNLLLGRETLAMYRVVLAESTHQPEVGQAFFDAGPAYARRQVADYFRALERRGLMKFDGADPAIIADLFLSMLAGDSHLRALFTQAPDQDRVRRIVAAAVELVAGRYGASPDFSSP